MSYTKDRDLADRLTPEIKQIVGPRLLVPAPLELDVSEATDLLVLKARDMRIAARVRRHGYEAAYPFDITIRAVRENGAKTEYEKVINERWGDWLFYGHADRSESAISRWWLVDLEVLRDAVAHEALGHVKLTKALQNNGDGTRFMALDLRSLAFTAGPPILVASSHPLPQRLH